MSSHETSSADPDETAVENVVIWYKMLDDVLGERARTLRSDPDFDTFYDNMERLLRKAIAEDSRALSP
jgi:hypothetical protein